MPNDFTLGAYNFYLRQLFKFVTLLYCVKSAVDVIKLFGPSIIVLRNR